MIWSTNYGRLLSQTVFTLFFAGRAYAPNCVIDGANIQDYLQNHFIEACGRLADRIAAFEGGSLLDGCVIGWDSMNEPFEGLCGWEDVQVNPTAQGSTLKKGTYPTPAQSLRLGMGQAQTVENWTFGVTGPSKNGTVTIDPKGRKVWADYVESSSSSTELVGELPDGTHPRWGWKRDVSKWPLGTCIWAQHGVWDIETGFILRPHYFATHPQTGDEVEFLSRFLETTLVGVCCSGAACACGGYCSGAAAGVRATAAVRRIGAAGTVHLLSTLLRRPHPHHTTLELVQRRRAGAAAREVLDYLASGQDRRARDSEVSARATRISARRRVCSWEWRLPHAHWRDRDAVRYGLEALVRLDRRREAQGGL